MNSPTLRDAWKGIAILAFIALAVLAAGLHPHVADATHLSWTSSCNDNFGQFDCTSNTNSASALCASQGGTFSATYFGQMCEGTTCSSGFWYYMCDIPDATPTCSTDPTMDGCPCSLSNACNTTTGTYSGGVCSAPQPAACQTCSASQGQTCTSAPNACGMTDSSGTIQCDGSCSSITPSNSLCAPSVSLSASSPVAYGGSTSLNWSSTNSPTSCSASGGWSGSQSGSGSATVGPLTSNPTSFTLSCSNAYGSGSASANVTVTAPNLTSTGLNVTTNSGASTLLPYTIKNSGNASVTTNFTNYLWVDADSTHTTDTTTWGTQSSAIAGTNPLAAGATQSSNYTWTAPTVSSLTTYYYYICADWNGTVTESNESDNCTSGGWKTITINPPSSAAITSCTPSPSSASTGQNVTWTVTTSGFSPSPTSYTWSVTGGTPSSQTSSATTFTSKFSSAASYAPSVSATNGSQTANASCSPVTVTGSSCTGSVTPTISASKTRIVSGSTSTITWSASGVSAGTTCTVSGTNIGGTGVNSITTSAADSSCNVASGSATPTISGQTTYTITCGGTSKSVTVNVVPSFNEF